MRSLSAVPIALIGAMLVFSPLQDGGTTHTATMIIRLLILSMLGVFLGMGIRGGCLKLPILSIGYVALAYLGLAALATTLSPYPHPSWQWFLVLASYVVFLYLLVFFTPRWEQIRVLAVLVVLVGLGEAAWAITQGLVWRMPRPSGSFFNPNFLAGYLVAAWAILLSGLLHRRGQSFVFVGSSKRHAVWGIGSGAALAVILIAILMTGSRGGLLAILVATVAVMTMRFGWRVAGGCTALVVMLILLIPNPIRDRAVTEHSYNPVAYARWQMWQGAVRQMVDYPLGVGLGVYQYTYPRYAFPVEGEITRYGKTAQTPHSEYLQMGVEMGPAAIMVFGAGVVLVCREAMRLMKSRLSRWQGGLVVGLSGAILALLTHAAIDSNLREPAIAILLLLCGGLILSASRLAAGGRCSVREVPVRSRILWGFVATIVLVALTAEVVRLGLAWKYFEVASRDAAEGKTTQAIQGFRQATELDPGKALYHHALASVMARIFQATRDEVAFELAEAEYAEAISLNPLDGRVSALLGQLRASAAKAPVQSSISREQRIIQARRALEAYDWAIELVPFSAPYRYERARLHWFLGEREAAERQAKEVTVIEPNFLPARLLLAQMALESDRLEGVKDQVREILERQARYQHWQKNAFEQIFLDVDVEPLRVVIEKKWATG